MDKNMCSLQVPTHETPFARYSALPVRLGVVKIGRWRK